MSFTKQRERPGWADRFGRRAAAHPRSRPRATNHGPHPTPSPQLIENTTRKITFCSQHAAIKTHRKPLKARLTLFPNRNNSTPFFRTQSEQKAKVRAEREALTSLDRHRGEFAASQLIENKARKNTFYSRAPKVEVYENKGQSAILLAPQTRVFVPRGSACLIGRVRSRRTCSYGPSKHFGPNRWNGTRIRIVALDAPRVCCAPHAGGVPQEPAR